MNSTSSGGSGPQIVPGHVSYAPDYKSKPEVGDREFAGMRAILEGSERVDTDAIVRKIAAWLMADSNGRGARADLDPETAAKLAEEIVVTFGRGGTVEVTTREGAGFPLGKGRP